MQITDELKKELRAQALKASEGAYAPYSKALIGSAILTDDDQIYSGCNIENSSYGGTVCAERVAIWKAVSEGTRKLKAVYVYSQPGWPPCGLCRQVISEFGAPETLIIIGDGEGNEKTMPFGEVFPLAFTPEEYNNYSN